MTSKTIDLDELLNEWHKLKKKKSELSDREDEIKSIIKKILKKEKTDVLSGEDFTVKEKTITRTVLSNIPKEIKDKYSKKSVCVVYYLSRNK